MRTVPESIKLALQDPSLPIQKRILLYRRVWNAQGAKYTLETTPVDVTELLVEAGSIKMALDTDEVDKWDASNVTLTFNNDLNCFKEGLKGGLFEQAVLWGSKFVYNIENAGSQAPQESITVFTGYVYSSPVFRENGNQIELTITSSLDALEYVSAEDFCLSAADELATEVEAENEDDQGKEFTTVQTGVGYVDSVKYGADLTSALILAAGTDYDVSDTNEYSLPAKISLKFTPTAGYKMWVSYRYWHKDMKIEDIVNALLDLAGVEKRDVEPAMFSGQDQAVAIEVLSKTNAQCFLFTVSDDDTAGACLVGQTPINGEWGNCISYCVRDSRANYIVDGNPGEGIYFPMNLSLSFDRDRTIGDRGGFCLVDKDGNGVYAGIRTIRSGTMSEVYELKKWVTYTTGHKWRDETMKQRGISVQNTEKGLQIIPYVVQNGYLICQGNASLSGIQVDKMGTATERLNPLYGGNCSFKMGYLDYQPSEDEMSSKTWEDIKASSHFFTEPVVILQGKAQSIGFEHWGKISAVVTKENAGTGSFFWAESNDGRNWSPLIKINLDENIPSSAEYLRVYYKCTSAYNARELISSLKLTQILSSTNIPLINMTDLTVGEAIAQLAKMVSYEIGFNQDGVFFFRSRQGRYADTEINSSSLIEVDNHGADIDNLANRVSVEFGAFKTTVDDFTEGKPRPNTIDTYGVHEKSISSDNFIPADNVDISAAVAKANYEALSTPGYTAQLDCRPDLSLELGDKITVSSENTQIADKNWSDYSKFLKLPIWKRVFKITGIEISFAKRLMSLTLKDVTSASDVPNLEYNVYQTQFPTPLDYKE